MNERKKRKKKKKKKKMKENEMRKETEEAWVPAQWTKAGRTIPLPNLPDPKGNFDMFSWIAPKESLYRNTSN